MTTKDTTPPIIVLETTLPKSSDKDSSIKMVDLSLHADEASPHQQDEQEASLANKDESLPLVNKDGAPLGSHEEILPLGSKEEILLLGSKDENFPLTNKKENFPLGKKEESLSRANKKEAPQNDKAKQHDTPTAKKNTSPPSQACYFARMFTGASLLPYLSILILSLLAFSMSYFKPEIWLVEGHELLTLLETNTASLLAITSANGAMPIIDILSHSTDLIIMHDAFVRWPFTALLLQEVFFYSTLPPELTYAALAISLCAAVLFATYMLARATGSSPKQGLAAICITLASPVYLAIYSVDIGTLMLTVWILLAYTCFYLAWVQDRALSWLIAAFFFTALAGLSASIGWMLLPCITSILFLSWRCTFARASALDAVLAFTLFLIFFGAIIGIYAILPEGRDILQALLNASTGSWQWAFGTEAQKEYLLGLALFSLPWLLIIPCTFIQSVRKLPQAFIQARTANPGQGWLWWALCTSLISLALLNTPTLADMYVLWPLASILFAHALLGMQARQTRLFFKLCAVLLVLCAAFFLYLAAVPSFSDTMPLPLRQFTMPLFFMQTELTTMPLVLLACMLLVLAYILLEELDATQPQGFLLALSIGFCIWTTSALSLAPLAISPEALQSLPFSSSEIAKELPPETTLEIEIDLPAPTGLAPETEAPSTSTDRPETISPVKIKGEVKEKVKGEVKEKLKDKSTNVSTKVSTDTPNLPAKVSKENPNPLAEPVSAPKVEPVSTPKAKPVSTPKADGATAPKAKAAPAPKADGASTPEAKPANALDLPQATPEKP